MLQEYIDVEPGAAPRITGRRIRVQDIISYYQGGWSVGKISQEYQLTLPQVHAALAYYYENQDELDLNLKQEQDQLLQLPSLITLLDQLVQLDLVTTPNEIAEDYQITSDAVYQAIRRGRLDARKSGGTWLILRRDARNLWGEK